jgi:mRNA-degrading endonuclease RelE of RelBE toxin-antitoxin system
MAMVLITDEVIEQIEALPLPIQLRVRRIIARLARWPSVSGAKPLRGSLAGCYRIRTGDYRVQFHATIHSATAVLTINKVGHRDGFYDD